MKGVLSCTESQAIQMVNIKTMAVVRTEAGFKIVLFAQEKIILIYY